MIRSTLLVALLATMVTPAHAAKRNEVRFEAHVTIEKRATVVGGDADIGKEIEYTMTVRGTGDDTATDVLVKDPIPANTSYVPGSLKIGTAGQTDAPGDDKAEHAGGEAVFHLGSMPHGAVRTVTFRAKAERSAAATKVKNTATVTYASQTVPDATGRASDSASTPVLPYADVTVRKTGPATVRPGAPIEDTLVVTNKGPSLALGVKLTDAPDGDKCTTGEPCDLGDIDAGDTRTITVRRAAPADAKQGQAITDTAVARTRSLDPDETNNTARATTRVVYQHDVSITKTGPRTARAGDRVEYVITVRNAGPDPAENARITDQVARQITEVTWDCRATGGAPRCDR